jgi:hypothetical protein
MSSTAPAPTPVVEDPHARMEWTYIVEYLANLGVTPQDLPDLPPEKVKQLMTEASTYASSRLTEVESRAHFVDKIHGASPPLG